ncbi:MAG: OadG family protein [Anaerovoracaceae bacterium]
MTFGEILSKAAVNTLLGMGTVFFMLVLIIAVISLFRFIPDKKKETEGKAEGEAGNSQFPQTSQASQRSQTELTQPGAPDDPLLIPVIMAALMAAMGEEGSATAIADGTCPYTVRSIRRR